MHLLQRLLHLPDKLPSLRNVDRPLGRLHHRRFFFAFAWLFLDEAGIFHLNVTGDALGNLVSTGPIHRLGDFIARNVHKLRPALRHCNHAVSRFLPQRVVCRPATHNHVVLANREVVKHARNRLPEFVLFLRRRIDFGCRCLAINGKHPHDALRIKHLAEPANHRAAKVSDRAGKVIAKVEVGNVALTLAGHDALAACLVTARP